MNVNIIAAFVKKEFKQILRDPSSILIAFILPLILLFLFGFGINFDTNTVKIGIVLNENTKETREITKSLISSKFLDCYFFKTVKDAAYQMQAGNIRGFAVFPVDFTKKLKSSRMADIQIITDGSEPNTAKFASSYIQGAFQAYLNYKNFEDGVKNPETASIQTIERIWYNPALKSTYFILPGSLAIIMTMTGCVLTALVIAREWERGTMEAILTTEITKGEFILSKYIAYFVLGVFSISFCLFIIIFIFKVPYRGSYFLLFISSSLFMLTGLGLGLLVSTAAKDQFIASQMAGTLGFMPSLMLSGLIYEIDSMPPFIQAISNIIPAKYFVSSVSTLFLAGNVYKTFFLNSVYMLLFSLFMYFLIYANTKDGIE